MFDIPSDEEITKVTVTKDTIETKKPEVLKIEGQKRPQIKGKKVKTKKDIETA